MSLYLLFSLAALASAQDCPSRIPFPENITVDGRAIICDGEPDNCITPDPHYYCHNIRIGEGVLKAESYLGYSDDDPDKTTDIEQLCKDSLADEVNPDLILSSGGPLCEEIGGDIIYTSDGEWEELDPPTEHNYCSLVCVISEEFEIYEF